MSSMSSLGCAGECSAVAGTVVMDATSTLLDGGIVRSGCELEPTTSTAPPHQTNLMNIVYDAYAHRTYCLRCPSTPLTSIRRTGSVRTVHIRVIYNIHQVGLM